MFNCQDHLMNFMYHLAVWPTWVRGAEKLSFWAISSSRLSTLPLNQWNYLKVYASLFSQWWNKVLLIYSSYKERKDLDKAEAEYVAQNIGNSHLIITDMARFYSSFLDHQFSYINFINTIGTAKTQGLRVLMGENCLQRRLGLHVSLCSCETL